MKDELRRRLGLALLLAAPALLFAWISIPREKLVPHDADPARAAWMLTGDEPAYLLTAQAIAAGHGQDLRTVNEARTYTNFQQRPIIGSDQWTWDFYRRNPAFRCWIDRRAAWGNRQTLHRPPLVALLAAPFALSPNGARWKACVLQGLLVTAGFAVLLALYRRRGASPQLAAAAGLVMLGGVPAAYYTCQMFPETITGLCQLLALALALSRPRAARWLGYGLLCLSLWGTARAVIGVFGAAGILALDALRRRAWADAAALAAGLCAYLAHNLWLWGYPMPPNPDTTSQLSAALIPRGLLLNFFDRSTGLLFLCPAAAVGIAALALLLRHRPRCAGTWAMLALFLGNVLTVAAFPIFRAGKCPAGRYQVIQCYLLLFALLQALSLGERSVTRRLAIALAILGPASLVISAFVLVWPSCWYESFHPLFKYKAINDCYSILPDLQGGGRRLLVAWIAVLALPLCGPEIAALVSRLRGKGAGGSAP